MSLLKNKTAEYESRSVNVMVAKHCFSALENHSF